MDFELGEEDELLRDTVRELCDQEIRPHAASWDEARALPAGLLPHLGELGLLAMRRPEAEGGAGLSMVAAASLVEELAAADGALALVLSCHNFLGLAHVAQALREPQRAAELPAMLDGRRVVAWALDERGGSMRTRARLDGEHWVLDGDKDDVVGAAVAGRIVVFASTREPTGHGAGDRPAPEDLVALLVDANAPGLAIGDPLRSLGMRAAGTAQVRLDGVRVPQARRLVGALDTWAQAQGLLDRSRIGIAAIASGIGRGALRAATAYAQQREQFGRPIASFQAIAWKLADMAVELEASWLLTLRAAWLDDAKQPFAAAASRAVLLASGAATRACSAALQIHGGYGYTREFPVERALRDARGCAIGQGAREVQRLRIAKAIAERFAA